MKSDPSLVWHRPLIDAKESSSINGAQQTAWRHAQGATQSLEASAQRQRRKPERFQASLGAYSATPREQAPRSGIPSLARQSASHSRGPHVRLGRQRVALPLLPAPRRDARDGTKWGRVVK
jgi:hypothetical protein